MKIVLDLETTGFKPEEGEEILQCSIITELGDVLLNEFYKPVSKTEWPEAETVNHISPDSLKDMPPFSDSVKKIEDILKEADALIGCNPEFDIGFLKAYGVSVPDTLEVIDAQQIYTKRYPGKKRLVVMAEKLGYDWGNENAHDGLADCRATLFCYNKLCPRDMSDVKTVDSIVKLFPISKEEYFSFYNKVEKVLKERSLIGNERAIHLDTPAGTLTVELSNGTSLQAWIGLTPKGTDYYKDLALAEVVEGDLVREGEASHDVNLYVWGDIDECYSHRFNLRREDMAEYIEEPLSKEELIDIIADYFSQQEPNERILEKIYEPLILTADLSEVNDEGAYISKENAAYRDNLINTLEHKDIEFLQYILKRIRKEEV